MKYVCIIIFVSYVGICCGMRLHLNVIEPVKKRTHTERNHGGKGVRCDWMNKIDTEGMALLHNAVWDRKTKKVQTLLTIKADPNVVTASQIIPLHIAAGFGHVHIVKLLIEAGAQTNAPDILGKTPQNWLIEAELDRNTHGAIEFMLQAMRNQDGTFTQEQKNKIYFLCSDDEEE